MKMNNKVMLITGGANGIGLEAAKLFAAEGAKVMIADLDENAMQAAVEAIGADKSAYIRTDVTSAEDNQAMVAACLEKFGRIDAFLANAGVEGKIGSIMDSSVENFEFVMNVNVRGVWLGLHNVLPVMKKQGGGAVVITSSGAGVQGSPALAPYNTSKHAVIGLMRCAAQEVAKDNIRINTVNPGAIDTRMIHSIGEGYFPDSADDFTAAMDAETPMGRLGQPAEVAKLMLFLSSDDASYCTGGVYMVDGGQSC